MIQDIEPKHPYNEWKKNAVPKKSSAVVQFRGQDLLLSLIHICAGDVQRKVQRHTRFAHTGTCGQQHKVRLVETVHPVVQHLSLIHISKIRLPRPVEVKNRMSMTTGTT